MARIRLERGPVVCERGELATTLWKRTKGLLGRAGLADDEGLWIPTSSIHMFGMRFAIDVDLRRPRGPGAEARARHQAVAGVGLHGREGGARAAGGSDRPVRRRGGGPPRHRAHLVDAAGRPYRPQRAPNLPGQVIGMSCRTSTIDVRQVRTSASCDSHRRRHRRTGSRRRGARPRGAGDAHPRPAPLRRDAAPAGSGCEHGDARRRRRPLRAHARRPLRIGHARVRDGDEPARAGAGAVRLRPRRPHRARLPPATACPCAGTRSSGTRWSRPGSPAGSGRAHSCCGSCTATSRPSSRTTAAASGSGTW